jgi:hypothetical protein
MNHAGYQAELSDLPGARQAQYRLTDPDGNTGDWVEVECRDYDELQLIVKRTIDQKLGKHGESLKDQPVVVGVDLSQAPWPPSGDGVGGAPPTSLPIPPPGFVASKDETETKLADAQDQGQQEPL